MVNLNLAFQYFISESWVSHTFFCLNFASAYWVNAIFSAQFYTLHCEVFSSINFFLIDFYNKKKQVELNIGTAAM